MESGSGKRDAAHHFMLADIAARLPALAAIPVARPPRSGLQIGRARGHSPSSQRVLRTDRELRRLALGLYRPPDQIIEVLGDLEQIAMIYPVARSCG